jgi:pterin-4a-carbinolamine dehydratase
MNMQQAVGTNLAAPQEKRKRPPKPIGVSEELVSEPIQSLLMDREAQERLKSERVQDAIKALPGWQVADEGRAIHRARAFPGHASALAFAAFVTSCARDLRVPFAVSIHDSRQVLFSLYGPRSHGRSGIVTDTALALAKVLG